MAITGQEGALASALNSAITAALEAQYGGPIGNPNYIPALSQGIANAIIPFLVGNVQVNPGQSVNVPGAGLLDGNNDPVTGNATGTVNTDGTIS
jgi:hypothetical protein